MFDQETLGIVALSKPRRASGDVKTALRLISQTGAQALHNAVAYSQIKVTAEMDGLTRIFNKKHMEQALSELIYRTACAAYDRRDQGGGASAQSLSVFLFDIDHFKHYNDTNGHLAGDKLLQALSRIVPETIRKDDTFGRFGGEEFLLILPNTNLAQALAAANKIRALVAGYPFPLPSAAPEVAHRERRSRRVSVPRPRCPEPAPRRRRGPLRGQATGPQPGGRGGQRQGAEVPPLSDDGAATPASPGLRSA